MWSWKGVTSIGNGGEQIPLEMLQPTTLSEKIADILHNLRQQFLCDTELTQG